MSRTNVTNGISCYIYFRIDTSNDKKHVVVADDHDVVITITNVVDDVVVAFLEMIIMLW